MRKKFGPIIVGIIIGFIAFVFIFEFGMNRRGMNGMEGGGYAGSVNGEPISLTEFNRYFNQQMEFYKALGAGQLTEEMIKMYRLKDRVFEDLAAKKLQVQEAERQGLIPSDAEIRDAIMEYPAFQRDGQFDRQMYKQLLEANNLKPGIFEKQVRDDIIQRQWRDYFKNLVRYSNEEVKREYLMTAEKRKLKYVLISLEAGRKQVKIPDSEVQSYFTDAAKKLQVQDRFEQGKAVQYKGKTFDQVKNEIARELASESKIAEVRKLNEELGKKVAAALKPTGSDAGVSGLIKGLALKLENTAAMARGNFYVPGAGDVREVEADAFSGKLGAAKAYSVAGGTLVAVVTSAESADLAKLNDTERTSLINRIIGRKENELFSQWMAQVKSKSKILKSSALGDGEEPEKS
jgi:parvulin-like peptidyl-prolyl isomerase